jgi:hypothetical protein
MMGADYRTGARTGAPSGGAGLKFKIDIECTPQEARTFLGLPDVESVQKALYSEIETRMRAALDRMEPDALLRNWMPAVKGWEELMKAFVPNLDPKKKARRSSP